LDKPIYPEGTSKTAIIANHLSVSTPKEGSLGIAVVVREYGRTLFVEPKIFSHIYPLTRKLPEGQRNK